MLWAFYWAQVALAVLGVYLLWAGLRGREIGDDYHPRCKRCGYDLYRLATAGRVWPECGEALRSPRAVHVGGVAQRNWRLVGLALVCGLFAYTLGPVRQLAWRAWVLRPATFVAAVKAGNEHVVNSLLNADPKLARIRPPGQTLLDLAVS